MNFFKLEVGFFSEIPFELLFFYFLLTFPSDSSLYPIFSHISRFLSDHSLSLDIQHKSILDIYMCSFLITYNL